jgi:hypothetical protein
METRLALAQGLKKRSTESALAELRSAVESDPTAPAPFEALLALAWGSGRTDLGGLLGSAVALLGSTHHVERMGVTVDVDAALAAAGALRAKPDSLGFEEAMARFVGPPRTWGVRRILALVEPMLPRVFPGAEGMLAGRARLPDPHPLNADVRAVAAALAVPPPPIFRGVGREVALLLTEPRVLVLGSELIDGGPRGIALFQAAYACARTAMHGSLYAAPRREAFALLEATLPETDGPLVRDLRKRLHSALPRKSKRDLERVVAEGRPADLRAEFARWEEEEARRALYCGIVLCRDLWGAVHFLAEASLAVARTEERRRALAATPAAREVLEFAASPACWDVMRRVYG